MSRELKVGLIGHRFMGKAHSHALHGLRFFFELDTTPVREVLCGLEEDLEAAAGRYGWRRRTRSWREVVEDPSIDVVDICTPGNTHCQIAVAQAAADKRWVRIPE